MTDRPHDHATVGDDGSPSLRAERLGLPVLADLVDGSRAAVVVLRTERRILYANPAACVLLGGRLKDLQGCDFLDGVPTDERAELLRHLDPETADPTITFSSSVRSGSNEREVVGSALPVENGNDPLLVVTLWDQSGAHSAVRKGAALLQTASMVATTNIDVLLTRIAQHIVEGTRSSKCGLAVAGGNDRLLHGGAFCQGHRPGALYRRASGAGWAGVSPRPATEWISAISGGAVRLGDVAGKPALMTDARERWTLDPVTRDYAESIADLPYRGCLSIPLSWQNRVIGVCTVHLPAEVAVLTESELALATALTDQASLAVTHARLSAQSSEAAALNERARLAGELHDSVIQALFSMTMYLRAAELSVSDVGSDRLGGLAQSLQQLSDLVRDALAEMRMLIFELRPDALIEEGLVSALRHQAAALSTRAGFAISVTGPEEQIALPTEAEQQLYRIAVEALNNVVKHADAAAAEARVEIEPDAVRLTVSDDGRGFDPRAANPGHLGLTTMNERAASIGARLNIDTAPGRGTRVRVVFSLQAETITGVAG